MSNTALNTYEVLWDNWASLITQLVKNPPAMQETPVRFLGWEGLLGKCLDNPLQYSCPENPMDRGAWWALVHSIAKSQTRWKWLSTAHYWIDLVNVWLLQRGKEKEWWPGFCSMSPSWVVLLLTKSGASLGAAGRRLVQFNHTVSPLYLPVPHLQI